jgi:hypothetical protein
MKNKVLLSKISTEIETIKKQDFFDIGHSNSLARLAFDCLSCAFFRTC